MSQSEGDRTETGGDGGSSPHGQETEICPFSSEQLWLEIAFAFAFAFVRVRVCSCACPCARVSFQLYLILSIIFPYLPDDNLKYVATYGKQLSLSFS